MNFYKIKFRKISLLFGFALAVFWLSISSFYRLTPIEFLKQSARIIAVPVYSYIYREDTKYVKDVTSKYWVGYPNILAESSFESWKRLQKTVPGFRLISYDIQGLNHYPIPFVYENPNAEYLQAFRAKYHLNSLIRDSHDEYDAMLRLGAWLGTRWDHGTDEVPGGNTVCDPVAVVEAGQHGAKFWCEIAAKTTVHAATALGWQARLVTASRDGYTWEHAAAEIWSNQFNKWFVMDTDFNVVYESSGVPLSAFELVHLGEKLQRSGQLKVRNIAPRKTSLPLVDLIPFYNYAHVDMRNDWCSRPLHRGSPAGGDTATWWTSRYHINELTAKRKVNNLTRFNWPVNSVAIYVISAKRLNNNQINFQIGLSGYSPIFKAFEIIIDSGNWQRLEGNKFDFTVLTGEHKILIRLLTTFGFIGPESKIVFSILE